MPIISATGNDVAKRRRPTAFKRCDQTTQRKAAWFARRIDPAQAAQDQTAHEFRWN